MTKPDQTINMTLRMAKVARAVEVETTEECKVVVDGLFWQDAVTDEFDVSEDITEYVE